MEWLPFGFKLVIGATPQGRDHSHSQKLHPENQKHTQEEQSRAAQFHCLGGLASLSKISTQQAWLPNHALALAGTPKLDYEEENNCQDQGKLYLLLNKIHLQLHFRLWINVSIIIIN